MADIGRILAGAGSGALMGGAATGPVGAVLGGLSGILSGLFGGGGGSKPKQPPWQLPNIGFNAQIPEVPATPPPQIPMPSAQTIDMTNIPEAVRMAAIRKYLNMPTADVQWSPSELGEWDFLKNG